MARAEHLDSREVASYLDRALGPAERDGIEAHLADCFECRDEVVQVARVRHTVRARRTWLVVAPAAAAAIIAFVLVRPPAGPPGSTLRAVEEPAPHVTLVAPADSAAVPVAGAPAFGWRSIAGGVSYRFTLTDESGDVVWTTTSADTSIRLPDSVRLHPGARYFWYVDALLTDGRSVTSGARLMRTAP